MLTVATGFILITLEQLCFPQQQMPRLTCYSAKRHMFCLCPHLSFSLSMVGTNFFHLGTQSSFCGHTSACPPLYYSRSHSPQPFLCLFSFENGTLFHKEQVLKSSLPKRLLVLWNVCSCEWNISKSIKLEIIQFGISCKLPAETSFPYENQFFFSNPGSCLESENFSIISVTGCPCYGVELTFSTTG